MNLPEMNLPEMNLLAVSADLMDRSKISAALADVVLVRSMDAVRTRLEDPRSPPAADTVVLVDLARVGTPRVGTATDLTDLSDLADLARSCSRVIAYGSHVDEAVLAAAESAGADALARSVFFRRLAAGTLV